MSIVVAIKTPTEIVVCSDGLELRLEGNHPIIYSGAKKVFCLPNQTLAFGYSGVASIGERRGV
jgi:hypothetical protein